MKKFLIIGLFMSLIGCAAVPHGPMGSVSGLQYGMTKLQMLDLLGKPDSIEIYKKPDQTRVEFYTYIQISESSQEKVPVCLINNRVVGWGQTFYEDHVSQDDTRLK